MFSWDEQTHGQKYFDYRRVAGARACDGAAGLSLIARHADQLTKVRDKVRKIAPKIDPPSPSYGAASIVIIEADMSKPRDIERIVATRLAQFKGCLDVLVRTACGNAD